MKHWTIRRRMLGSVAVIIALLIAMGGLAYTRLAVIERSATSAGNESIPGLYLSTKIASTVLTAYALTVEQLGQGDILQTQKLGSRWRANQDELEASIRKYDGMLRPESDRQVFESFKRLLEPFTRYQQEVLSLNADLKLKEVNETMHDRLDPALEKVREAIQATVNLNKVNAERSVGQISDSTMSAEYRMLGSVMATLACVAIGAHYLLRSIIRPLGQLTAIVDVMRSGDFSQRLTLERQDEFQVLAEGFNRMTDELTALVGQVQKSSGQVNASVTEISATARQQQATAGEIAATTTEIGATSREISATCRELVKTMSEVAEVTEHSAALAGGGQTGLSNMKDTMERVMEAAASINAKLSVLNDKAGNINKVVTTITKVADQTNLLSLNAAIEAEKAGEYGRGFAVVATEIRRLADQTAVATYDIEQMVKDIQSAVASGVMGMDRFSEEVRRGMAEIQQVGVQLSQIIVQVQTLAPRVESVNEGMQAQATGAEQISQSLTHLTEAARQTVQSLNQSGLAIGELNLVSSGLRNGVSRFKLLGASAA